MAREKHIQVTALNIAANPHPVGIYIEMLRRAAGRRVQSRASDYALITSPRKSSRAAHVYTGRILVWTEIDKDGAWVNIETEQELDDDEKDQIVIPDNAKPNYRTFNYVFDEKRHRLYFESRNEFDQTLGPTTASRLMDKLLARDIQGRRAPAVAVTIMPEDGAVDQILSLPRLRFLHIRVTRSNPDTASPGKRRVFDQMDAMHAKQIEQTITKAAGARRLEITKEVREFAEVGADDGFVIGEGREDGRKTRLSTEELPKQYEVSMESGQSFLGRLLSVVKLF